MTAVADALGPLDWAVVAAYGLLVVGIAWRAKRRQKSSEDYLLAGKRLPWWVLAASLLASSFSTISLLSLPGWGWSSGLHWWQMWIGELVAVLVIAAVFIPFYARQRVTTAYEFLEARFGRPTRWFATGGFLVLWVVRGGLLLLLTAKALVVFTSLDLNACIVIVGAAALLYSALGGLGAVAWTDLAQLVMIVVGVGACFVIVLSDLPDGLTSVFEANSASSGRPAASFSLSLGKWPSVLSGAFAYGVFALFVGGTNQQQVQRYVACRDVGSARRALFLSWGLGAFVGVMTVTLGAAIFAQYGAGFVGASDDVLTRFVTLRVPTGLAGILVAAVFAAAMSSIDSAIHALSTATLVDLIEPLLGVPLDDARRLSIARWLTAGFGVCCVGTALLATRLTTDVFSSLLDWIRLLAGPVLGLFLLGILTRTPRQRDVWIGMAAGFAVALALAPPSWPLGSSDPLWPPVRTGLGLHGMWTAAAALLVTVLTSLASTALGAGIRARFRDR